MEPKYLLNEDFISEQVIDESSADKFLYITGPFMGAEKRNRNGRIYKRDIIAREVDKLQKKIKNREAVGELEHPDTQKISSDRAAILITDLHMDGDFAMGKARVLPTPCGKTLEGLIRGGVHMGVSSRGTGSLGNDNVVCEDFNLITIDAVFMPSCPDAYVEAVNESVQWVLNESTGLYVQQKVQIEEAAHDFKKVIDEKGSKVIAQAFKDYINIIKKV